MKSFFCFGLFLLFSNLLFSQSIEEQEKNISPAKQRFSLGAGYCSNYVIGLGNLNGVNLRMNFEDAKSKLSIGLNYLFPGTFVKNDKATLSYSNPNLPSTVDVPVYRRLTFAELYLQFGRLLINTQMDEFSMYTNIGFSFMVFDEKINPTLPTNNNYYYNGLRESSATGMGGGINACIGYQYKIGKSFLFAEPKLLIFGSDDLVDEFMFSFGGTMGWRIVIN